MLKISQSDQEGISLKILCQILRSGSDREPFDIPSCFPYCTNKDLFTQKNSDLIGV